MPGPALQVRVGDARLLMCGLAADSRDLVVGDAFGDLAAPWHLTTREFVAVVAPPAYVDGLRGGNYVIAASDQPFDGKRIEALVEARGGEEEVAAGADAARFAAGGTILTDDYAPVDQRLATARRAP